MRLNMITARLFEPKPGFPLVNEPQPGVSLFHPRVFEYEAIDFIQDELTRFPKEECQSTYGAIRAPLDWQVIDQLPGPAAFFRVDIGMLLTYNHFFVTALDDYDLLIVMAEVEPRSSPRGIAPEDWVDLRNVKQLVNDIYNSVEVVLSPEAEANRLRATKGLEDASVATEVKTHNFPINPYYEEFYGRPPPDVSENESSKSSTKLEPQQKIGRE